MRVMGKYVERPKQLCVNAIWNVGRSKGPATRNDIVDDIVDFSSSTMAFNVAKIA